MTIGFDVIAINQSAYCRMGGGSCEVRKPTSGIRPNGKQRLFSLPYNEELCQRRYLKSFTGTVFLAPIFRPHQVVGRLAHGVNPTSCIYWQKSANELQFIRPHHRTFIVLGCALPRSMSTLTGTMSGHFGPPRGAANHVITLFTPKPLHHH